jgi:hypothetical protein
MERVYRSMFKKNMPNAANNRHSREGGNPGFLGSADWIPAFAGMTGIGL